MTRTSPRNRNLSPVPGNRDRRTFRCLLGLILFVALALRLAGLDRLPLWNDEQWQFRGIQCPPAQLRAHLNSSAEFSPPLSFILQRAAWLVRRSTADARLPGVVAGVGALIFLAWMIRRESGNTAALWTAGLASLSFPLIYYAQELRNYGLLAASALWLMAEAWNGTEEIRGGRLRVATWIRFVLAGLLASMFHFMAAVLVASLGLTAAVLTLNAPVFTRKGFVRWAALMTVWAGGHATIAGAVYAASRLYAGAKIDAARAANAAQWTPPPWSEIGALAAKFSWGVDAATIPWLALIAAAFLLARTARERRFAAFWIVPALLALALTAWVTPRWGGYRFDSETLTRHLVWMAWSACIPAGLGAWRLFERMRPFHGRVAGGVLLAVLLVAAQGRLLWHYYRMDCKREPIFGLRDAMESIGGGPRTLVLANVYDWHYLGFYLSGRVPVVAAPAHEQEQYASLNIDGWLEQIAIRYPDMVVKSTTYHPFSPEVSAVLDRVFVRRKTVAPNGHAARLEALGVKPLRGISQTIFYNEPGDFPEVARRMNRPVFQWITPAPLVSFRDETGRYEIFRVVQGLGSLCVHPAPTSLSASIRIARTDPAREFFLRGGGERHVVRVEPAPVRVLNPETRQWVPVSLETLVRIGDRLPSRIPCEAVPLPAPENKGAQTWTVEAVSGPLFVTDGSADDGNRCGEVLPGKRDGHE